LLQSRQTSQETPETRLGTSPVANRRDGHATLRMTGPRDPLNHNHARRMGEYQLRAPAAVWESFDLRDM
jgi:hypothetical protein